MPKSITITIDPAGKTIVQTHGYVGRACKDASRAVEEQLGTVTAETLTAEYHATVKPTTTTNA